MYARFLRHINVACTAFYDFEHSHVEFYGPSANTPDEAIQLSI